MGKEDDARAKVVPVVERLRASFNSGRTRPVEYRKQQLNQIIKMFTEREKDIAESCKSDLGRNHFNAWVGEIYGTKAEAQFALKHLDEWASRKTVSTPLPMHPGSSYIQPEPYGVCLVVGPWNFPYYTSVTPVISAIAAGNCVLLKPSELAPACAAVLSKLFAEYLDPQCFAVVEGDEFIARALLDEKFDHICFTGSTQKGKLVAQAAAKNLTPTLLELGGKSPCIVDKTANLRVAARRIVSGKFMNAGQICVAPDYVLAHKSIERALVSEMKQCVLDFYGKDPQKCEDYGRIITPRHAKRLAECMKDGDVVVGGKTDPENRYIAPTILRNVRQDSLLMNEEIFGPILPVITVPDVENAVARVNEGGKPLALYIFGDDKVAKYVLDNTSSGSVAVNDTLFQIMNPNMPFGGVGSSGIGAYHGHFGFQEFSHQKAILHKGTRLDLPLRYPPFTPGKARIFRTVLDSCGGGGGVQLRAWNLVFVAAALTVAYAKVRSRL